MRSARLALADRRRHGLGPISAGVIQPAAQMGKRNRWRPAKCRRSMAISADSDGQLTAILDPALGCLAELRRRRKLKK